MADTYRVTGQTEILDLQATGQPQRAVEVSYETVPSGIRGTVIVPKAGYSVEAVQREIEADAAVREQVAGL